MHADVHAIGDDTTFDGHKAHVNMLCGMTGFAITEDLPKNHKPYQ